MSMEAEIVDRQKWKSEPQTQCAEIKYIFKDTRYTWW